MPVENANDIVLKQSRTKISIIQQKISHCAGLLNLVLQGDVASKQAVVDLLKAASFELESMDVSILNPII